MSGFSGMKRQSAPRSRAWATLVGAAFAAVCLLGPRQALALSLGEAVGYAVLGFGMVDITVSSGSTLVDGNLGVGPDGQVTFSGGGEITGELRLHDGTGPGGPASATVSGGSTCNGGPGCTPVFVDLNGAVQDAIQASADAQALAGTTLSGVSNSLNNNLVSAGGWNVFEVTNDISLSGGGVLSLTGGPGDFFVFNIGGTIKMSGGSEISLAGGIDASHILFNVVGAGEKLDFSGNSNTFGTFLAPDRDIIISGGIHEGAFIGSQDHELKLQSGPTVLQNAFVPEPHAALLFTSGVVIVALAIRRRLNAA